MAESVWFPPRRSIFASLHPAPFPPAPTHYGVQLCAGGGEKAGARDPGLAAAQPLVLGSPGASETTAWLLEVPSSQHSGHGGGALFMCPQSLPPSSGFFLHRNYLFLFQKLYSSLFAKKKKQAKPQCRKGKLLPCSAMSVYPRFFLFYYKWDQIGFPAVAQRGQCRPGSAGTQVRSLAPPSCVKDPALPQLWLGSQLQLRSDPWPRNCMCGEAAEKEGGGRRFSHSFFKPTSCILTAFHAITSLSFF